MSKTILFTGSNGFVGKSIIHLFEESFQIISLDLVNANIMCDLTKSIPDIPSVDMVIHAAGKAHIEPKTKQIEKLFYDINYHGTKNLLKGLENSPPDAFIFISSVAVYGAESGEEITEEHPLNGLSPYALSKLKAEKYISKWCIKNKVTLSILRPSLIAGKNPPGNLGAMINGMKTSMYFRIGKGSSRKSILMVKDIAILIPKLAEVGGIYNVCDNHHPSFVELEKTISNQLNKKVPVSIPLWVAKLLGFVGDIVGNKFPINSSKVQKIIQPLTFSNEKAKRELGWEPLDVLENFKIN
jgi:GlcNAc-P-P-Und epimerase